MLHTKPTGPYNGLTIVLSNPSRFDKAGLLSATGGYLVQEALKPDISRYGCDIRTKENVSLLPGTKCILLLGEPAMHYWIPSTKENTLNELRGTPLEFKGIPAIASYFPQDAADIKNYEAEFNKQSDISIEDEYDNEDDFGDDKRRHGKTRRKNFGFWLYKDIAKCRNIMKYGIPTSPLVHYQIYPNSELIIDTLTNTKGKHLYIDIETDSNLQILCFAFSFELPFVYIVPCINWNYEWAYLNLPQILRALNIAFRDNIVVAHNGSNFDFFVLAHKYCIGINKSYDTMLAMSRCFPDVEKSLGHCASLFTYLPFHKDENPGAYYTQEQMKNMMLYCGKDVYAMMLIKQSIDLYASRISGLQASIDQANASIKPYLIATLTGMRYDKNIIDSIFIENDRLMKQYLRFLDILIGKETLDKIRGKGHSAMPTSNKQCCEYFHNLLGYPIVAKGKERKDGTKGPSLGKKAIFKLRLRQDNPVLDIVIAYRETQKESSSLKFVPWKE